jgi:hypothetical protein
MPMSSYATQKNSVTVQSSSDWGSWFRNYRETSRSLKSCRQRLTEGNAKLDPALALPPSGQGLASLDSQELGGGGRA